MTAFRRGGARRSTGRMPVPPKGDPQREGQRCRLGAGATKCPRAARCTPRAKPARVGGPRCASFSALVNGARARPGLQGRVTSPLSCHTDSTGSQKKAKSRSLSSSARQSLVDEPRDDSVSTGRRQPEHRQNACATRKQECSRRDSSAAGGKSRRKTCATAASE
jgi:hypothetical protein